MKERGVEFNYHPLVTLAIILLTWIGLAIGAALLIDMVIKVWNI